MITQRFSFWFSFQRYCLLCSPHLRWGLNGRPVIVDEATHKPVAILEGRDGASLKEWLKQNKHVTAATRDRASAYAQAVAEILPDCHAGCRPFPSAPESDGCREQDH